jgi:hypothetical protein
MPTPQEFSKILSEIASDRLTLICGKHNYVAARKRANATMAIPPMPNGCKLCWENYYITDLALTPPAKRQERLDELEEVIHHAIEFEKKGTFGKDFELYEPQDGRFEVKIERDNPENLTDSKGSKANN